MGWLSNVVKNPVKALGGGLVGGAVLGPVGTVLGTTAAANNAQSQKDQLNAARNSTAPNLTPGQQQLLREQDIARGEARGNALFVKDPTMQSILKQRQDMAQGANAAEYQGMRDDMIASQQAANKGYLRQLLSAQGAGGVGGARGAAQVGELAGSFANTRADAERKLLLDNIALKNQGVNSLQDFLFKQKFGTLAQGLGEAQLGVADRTGYMQGQIGQSMAAAANQQPKQGILGQVFGGIF